MALDPRYARRVAPRLRVIANGDEEVNAYRSVIASAVATTGTMVERFDPVAGLERAARVDEPAAAPETRMLGKPPSHPDDYVDRRTRVNCFVELADPDARIPALLAGAPRQGNLFVASLTRRQIELLAADESAASVTYVEPGVPLSHPRPRIVARRVGEPPRRVPEGRTEPDAPEPQDGQGTVLIGLVDVGGFDFAHPDFLVRDEVGGAGAVPGTRFHTIWDQGWTGEADPDAPFGVGRLLTRERMNEAIRGARTFGVSASDILPQSTEEVGSHATHVASIAAGNRGVCPDAVIAGVSIALTESERDRHLTFYDSTRLAQAVRYLFDLGEREGLPTVVNVSLGTNGHAHDGTSPISRWIDHLLMKPGRCVCVAVGNAGQEAPRFEGDLGYLTGRIHASGRVPSRGLEVDLEWQVVGNGIVDVSENELEIWYEAGDEFSVRVRSPSGVWCDPVGPGEFYENLRLPSETFLSVYNEPFHPANGANRISIFLSPRLKDRVVGIESGVWTVRLRGIEVRDGRFDAWIERDDPRPLGRLGESRAWLFPSFFSKRSNVDRASVSSLACGRHVIAVGNCDPASDRVHASSSQGPTRDGRYKPDIAAPGTDIPAARGFAGRDDDQLWVSMTGTSMASPYVAGIAARMLAREPRLTSSQIMGVMRRTAQPLPGSDYAWKDDAGFGVIRPEACLAHASTPFRARDLGAGGGEGTVP